MSTAERKELDELLLTIWLQTVCPANECLPDFHILPLDTDTGE
jgi:hypothetical protein